MFSVCPHLCVCVEGGGGRGTPARSRRRGGYPSQVQPGEGEVPHLGYPPPSDLAGEGAPLPGVYPTFCPLPIRPGWVVPLWGGPHLGYPPSDLAGGTPARGYLPQVPSCQTWLGVPLPGVPHLGYPSPSDLGGGGVPPVRPGQGGNPPWVPPCQTWPGGYPCRGSTPPQVTDAVLDTPRSVCLLHSRRRTLLLVILFVGFHREIHNGIYMEANEHVKDNQASQSLIWDQQLGYSLHHWYSVSDIRWHHLWVFLVHFLVLYLHQSLRQNKHIDFDFPSKQWFIGTCIER